MYSIIIYQKEEFKTSKTLVKFWGLNRGGQEEVEKRQKKFSKTFFYSIQPQLQDPNVCGPAANLINLYGVVMEQHIFIVIEYRGHL